jgi:hypothetical protein
MTKTPKEELPNVTYTDPDYRDPRYRDSAFQSFEDLAKRLLGVSKKEIDRRGRAYDRKRRPRVKSA